MCPANAKEMKMRILNRRKEKRARLSSGHVIKTKEEKQSIRYINKRGEGSLTYRSGDTLL
jgi:hypothetical protein